MNVVNLGKTIPSASSNTPAGSSSAKANRSTDFKDPLLEDDEDDQNFDSCLKSYVQCNASDKADASSASSTEKYDAAESEGDDKTDSSDEISVEVQVLQEITIQSLPNQTALNLDASSLSIIDEGTTSSQTNAEINTNENTATNTTDVSTPSVVEIMDTSSVKNIFPVTAGDHNVQDVTLIANKTNTSALSPSNADASPAVIQDTMTKGSQTSDQIAATQASEENVAAIADQNDDAETTENTVTTAQTDEGKKLTGKENAMTRGKGKKLGLLKQQDSAEGSEHIEKGKNKGRISNESRKKNTRLAKDGELKTEDEILPNLKEGKSEFSGTSYAESEATDHIMSAWEQRNTEIDSLVNERTGLSGIEDLTSVDQLRTHSWRNANVSETTTAKAEVMPKTALKDVPEIIHGILNSSNLALPKRIEIPLKTPEGSIIQLYLQDVNGQIRAQVSTNDKLVLESLQREVALLKDMPFENKVTWTPPQFEHQESQQQTSDRQPQQQQSRQQTRQQDEENSKFEEAMNFFDALRKEES